jgi:hypothetical protein
MKQMVTDLNLLRKLKCYQGAVVLRFILISLALLSSSMIASASEYCYDQYEGDIQRVNVELGPLLKRQEQIDGRIAQIFVQIAQLSSQLTAAATKFPPDVPTIQTIGQQIANLNQERTSLESEGHRIIDRVTALRGVIPADLQGKLRGCIEASAPANRLVNFTIQALAILSTGGASLILPPKALYVDMSAVLNGYPTGGPHSIINEAREAALRGLPGGLGNPDNDFGRTVRDPGRLLRCPFGGC